jgi:hypothetical protein
VRVQQQVPAHDGDLPFDRTIRFSIGINAASGTWGGQTFPITSGRSSPSNARSRSMPPSHRPTPRWRRHSSMMTECLPRSRWRTPRKRQQAGRGRQPRSTPRMLTRRPSLLSVRCAQATWIWARSCSAGGSQQPKFAKSDCYRRYYSPLYGSACGGAASPKGIRPSRPARPNECGIDAMDRDFPLLRT